MNISMIDPSLFTGRYNDSLCAALARAGQGVTLHARRFRETDAIAPDGYTYCPHFFPLAERLRPVLGDGGAMKALKGAEYLAQVTLGDLDALKASDVVHVQWLPFARADAQLLKRLRGKGNRPALVHTVHNADAYHGDAGAQGRGYGALLTLFDRLIVHGPETRDALLGTGLPAERIAIVPHPPMRLARADTAMLAQVPDARLPRVLLFGTLRPYKGLDILIDACVALWRAGHAFELALAGKPFMDVGPLLSRVLEAGFADRLVTDFDFLPEARLDAHIRKADILAFPYRHIDSSGAFLSALHYGKAMVASRVGMFARLESSAVTLCPPGNAAALGQAIAPLMDARNRDAAGKAALDLLAHQGDWDDAAGATLRVYQDALRAREGTETV